tara:strand:- start:2549 stop:2716 length:168 start_codon:yes stop_codon:yes gene_type:complete
MIENNYFDSEFFEEPLDEENLESQQDLEEPNDQFILQKLKKGKNKIKTKKLYMAS